MTREPLRVLIVDDSAHARIVTRMVLQAIDAEVRECADGRAALKALKEWRADIVVVDYEMLPVNGVEFTRSLREAEANDARRSRTPILMVTGHNSSKVVLEAVKAGVDAFINKPISTGMLLTRIEKVLAQAERDGPARARTTQSQVHFIDEDAGRTRRAG